MKTTHEVTKGSHKVMIVTRNGDGDAAITRHMTIREWHDIYAPRLNEHCKRVHRDPTKEVYEER